jgi:Flp pilus assembly CpaF family ATPase
MHIRHPHCLRLEAGGPGNVSYGELVFRASCMRPDWLIVGELIGSEAMRALQIMGRGHAAIATVHALGVEDALAQLEALCLMANLGLGLGEIRRLIASAIRLITHQEFSPTARPHRRLTQMVELCGVENDRYVLKPLFRYDPQTEQLASVGKPSWQT